ncbi:Z1 domain-containing protein [Gordonia sp. NPDC003424]
MDNAELDELYDDFVSRLDSKTPAEVMRILRRYGASEDRLAQIQDRYEAEMASIKERSIAKEVVNSGRTTWYTGPREGDLYWPTIRRRLEEKGWSGPSIAALDSSSTQIMSRLDHPKTPEFRSRGLVVGHVQSGKTTSFTAVMAKAADRNYKFFIVLAGIHNSLRRQTQLRLEHELASQHPEDWFTLTTPDDDFLKPAANAVTYFAGPDRQKILCVVKKNGTVLTKLEKWLDDASEHLKTCATLIIDDEADQASVATPKINPLILQIMDKLPRSVYLAYTATPFANLLINPANTNDLYPRDFIISLPSPKPPYFGTEVLFGRDPIDADDSKQIDDGYDMIREIPEDEVHNVRPLSKADYEGFQPSITGQLRESILYFWLATAARRIRDIGNEHSTMLIHTSVRTEIHNSFKRPIESFTDRIEEQIRSQDQSLISELEMLWNREASTVPAREFNRTTIPFTKVLAALPQVLGDCRVILDNASSTDRLDYEGAPVTAIAVGGNTLSRGLTLEGLIVSYFVRAVSAYDTLLQMGRWFGYREGYEDLPRVWLTDELRDWFRHLATVEAEIRRDVENYMSDDLHPLNFAVRIRQHSALRVTAAAKMTDAVSATTAFGGRRIQTHFFEIGADNVRTNQAAFTDLVQEIIRSDIEIDHVKPADPYIWRGVDFTLVTKFLGRYSFHPDAYESNDNVLLGYIRKQVEKGTLKEWNVVLTNNRGAPSEYRVPNSDVVVGTAVRSRLKKSDVVDIKTLMSRKDAALDLADADTRIVGLDENGIRDLRSSKAPGVGLLVLYVIDKDSTPSEARAEKSREPLGAPDHLIGVGVVFPPVDGQDSTVEYVSADLSGVELEELDPDSVEASA